MTKNGVIVAPRKKDDDPDVYMTVQIESAYPGGLNAWKRFLLKTMKYPAEAQDNRIQGTVSVKFIVDTSGVVSNVEAISGPSELQQEAVNVIGKSGRWTPAIQNGRKVKSQKVQPITFRLDE